MLVALLTAVAPDEATRDAMLGDLAEDAAALEARAGPRTARRWYRRQVLTSIPPLIRLSMRRLPVRGWGGAVLAALGGYLALTVLVFAVARTLRAAGGPEARAVELSQGAVAMIRILGAIIGGYVAAWIGRHAPYTSATVLGILFVLIGFIAIRLELQRVQVVTYVVLQLTAIPVTVCGAAIRTRLRARHGPAK